eukprot:3163911-Pyramimonas_sp.AAC.1
MDVELGFPLMDVNEDRTRSALVCNRESSRDQVHRSLTESLANGSALRTSLDAPRAELLVSPLRAVRRP